MKCSLLTLSCALDGELSRERQLELDAHLITCERCKTGMRYLREETERISLLAPVRLSEDKATALLERSRVLVSVNGPTLLGGPDPSDAGVTQQLRTPPDPFGSLGISAAILDLPPTPEPAAATPPYEVEEESPAEPASADSAEPGPELEHGSAFEAEEADHSASGALGAVPEELWLADAAEEVATQSATEPPDSSDEQASPAFPEEDTLSPSDSPPPAVEHWASDTRPSSIVVPGWEPATELKMSWGDIPAATPSADTWAPDLTGIPVSRESAPEPPPAPFPAAPPPTRPAAAAVPGLQADRRPSSPGREAPRRSAGGSFRRPSAPKSAGDGREARSWTRTGLIAMAALAAVLIAWNFTHGSKPAATHHHQASPSASAQPSPSGTAAPSPTPTPTPTPTSTPLALTGVQTVGGTGSGYQVQTVRYGVHGSQFWVVFQMVQGSGSPQITAGFDGPETLYVEMQGVAPGTQVPQPAAGTVVSSISVGHVAGFTGAVYVLHLTRAVQLSPSLLPGTDSGGAGERYLAILQ